MAKYVLPIEIRLLEEGGYLATSLALPGFLVQADTVEKVVELAPGVAQALVEAMHTLFYVALNMHLRKMRRWRTEMRNRRNTYWYLEEIRRT